MNNTEKTVEELKDNVTHAAYNIAADVKDAAQSARDTAKQALNNTKDHLQDAVDDVTPKAKKQASEANKVLHQGLDAARDAGAKVKSSAMSGMSSCENYITEKPMRSVAIAAAAGALLAAVLVKSRRNSDR